MGGWGLKCLMKEREEREKVSGLMFCYFFLEIENFSMQEENSDPFLPPPLLPLIPIFHSLLSDFTGFINAARIAW